MLVNVVAQHKVREEGAPDADLAAKNDLVECVRAKEDAVVQNSEPEGDAEEADQPECKFVRSSAPLTPVGVLSTAPR